MRPWRTHLARSATTGVIVGVFVAVAAFIGVKLASADPGGPVSPDAMTFAGVLRERAARSTTLTFVFRKGTTEVCRTATMPFMPDTTGAFSVRVPMEPARCPRSLFDGSTVTYDVLLDGETMPIVSGVEVSPVPYARFADQAGVNNDCPAGYTLLQAAESPGIVCVRYLTLGAVTARDDVVKVGRGASAFWIDRWEAAIHHARTGALLGTANTVGGGDDNIASSGLSRSGQRSEGDFPALALSHAGMPTVNVTWFQANEACRATGKRLPTGSEWLSAASGTEDNPTRCNISSSGIRASHDTRTCTSASGAHDMVGNLWEWTAEWYAGAGGTSMRVNCSVQNWPSDYNQDGTCNVNGIVNRGGGNGIGIPSAAIRGGSMSDGSSAGIFAFDIDAAPSAAGPTVGFRCVIPR